MIARPPPRVNLFVENKEVGIDIQFQLDWKYEVGTRKDELKAFCLQFIVPRSYFILLGDGSAVHDDDFAVHEAVAFADEEGGDFGQLGGAAHAAGGGPELVHLDEAVGQLVRQLRVEDAGGDGVDGDAEGRGLARQTLREADDGGLRRGVVDGRGERADGPDGGDVEDRALALPNHLFINRLGDGEEAVDVGVDDRVPGAVGGGGEVVAAVDGGVVDEDVQAAPLLHEFPRHVLEADAVCDGDFEGVGAAAVRLDLGPGLFGQVFARVVVEGHVGALAREDLADGGAEAARAPRHERTLPFQKKTQGDSLQLDIV